MGGADRGGVKVRGDYRVTSERRTAVRGRPAAISAYVTSHHSHGASHITAAPAGDVGERGRWSG
jgi:hypothetical protein